MPISVPLLIYDIPAQGPSKSLKDCRLADLIALSQLSYIGPLLISLGHHRPQRRIQTTELLRHVASLLATVLDKYQDALVVGVIVECYGSC